MRLNLAEAGELEIHGSHLMRFKDLAMTSFIVVIIFEVEMPSSTEPRFTPTLQNETQMADVQRMFRGISSAFSTQNARFSGALPT